MNQRWLWAVLGGLLLLGGKKVVTSKDSAKNREKYAPAIASAEQAHGIPAGLLGRLIQQESHFRSDIITGATRSPVGALGIAQFMPATAKMLGIDPLNPAQAINGAGRYLASLYRQTHDWRQAVAAYNWGIGRVLRASQQHGGNWLAHAPTETKHYVAAVMA